MNVLLDAERAIYILKEDYHNANKVNSRFKPGYFCTNENLAYIRDEDVKDGNVLTVCGSGDQVFKSLLCGASKVDTFDYNPLQYYIYELKKASIISLSREEYLQYFPLYGGNMEEMYNIKYYDKVKENLSEDAREFWDIIYDKCNDYYKLYLFELFSYSIHFNSDYTRNFAELKELLKSKEINFKYSDIYNMPDLVDNKYNIIVLSNIFDHLHRYKKVSQDEYVSFIKDRYMPLLEDDGLCFFHYQFSFFHEKLFANEENIMVGTDDVKVLRK